MYLRNKIIAVGIATVLALTSTSCSKDSGSKGFDPNMDQEADVTPDWPRVETQGPVETVVIGVGCGSPDELKVDQAHLNSEGFAVIPGSIATVSTIVDLSTETANKPPKARQKFFRGDRAAGTFVSSLPPTDTLNAQFNNSKRKAILIGDENGIGETNTGLVLDYFANVPGRVQRSSVPNFTLVVDYFGGSMAGQIPDGDETTLDREAGSYSGSDLSAPFVSNFVDPVDARYEGNLMDYDNPGEPFLKRVDNSGKPDYQESFDLKNIPGEVVAMITDPLPSSRDQMVCASVAIIPPPIERVLA